MNILYDHQAFSTHRYGGITRYFYEIANTLGRIEGNHVEIFAPLYVNEYFKTGDSIMPNGVYVPPIPRSLRFIKAIDDLASLSLRMRRGIDIFHETYYGAKDCKPPLARRIVTVYDMVHERLPSYFRKEDETPTLKARAVKRADHVICISENTRHDLVELLGIPEEKTSVVHLGYSLTARPGAARIDAGKRPYILFVGHRNQFRNVERLLRVYARSVLLKDQFALLFFGGGVLQQHEEDLMRKLGLNSENVRHLSGGDDVLASLYAQAAAFVYPSLYEGFGIPPLEAMSFGCPVVCSNTSSIPEVVGDAAELFDPESDEEMGRALEHVVSSGERRAELVVRGQQRCSQFSWGKCGLETLAVYQKILARGAE